MHALLIDLLQYLNHNPYSLYNDLTTIAAFYGENQVIKKESHKTELCNI